MKKTKEKGDDMETEPLLRDIKEKHMQIEVSLIIFTIK